MKEELTKEVEKARENKEWRREYMAWISELEESKEEAREEARKAEREETAIRMLKDNMPISKIILYSRLPESRILELQQNLAEN